MDYYYKCLKEKSYQNGKYSLEAVQPEDIEKIRQWRNEQMDILRQSNPISIKEQIQYYEKYVWPEMDKNQPDKILLSIKSNNELVGYGGLVNISWENLRGEISFLLDTKFANTSKDYAELFPEFLKLIQFISFKELSLYRIFGELFDIRPQYGKAFENTGFVLEGVLKAHTRLNGKPVDSLVYGLLYDDYKTFFQGIKKYPNVLITSISKKVPLIQAVIRGVHKINPTIKVFGCDTDPNCIGKHFVEEFWEMPRLEDLTKEQLIKYCRKNNIGLIIPTRDGELEFFSSIKNQLINENIHVMVSELDSIHICLDKLVFAQLQHVCAITASSEIGDIDSTRYVVKKRFGAGSDLIGLNLDKKEALDHSENLRNAIFQPFISGDEISVDAYVSCDGIVKGIVMRRRDIVIGGESQVTTTFSNNELEKLFQIIISSLNLYGHVILQALITESGSIHVIECNPRFGGASTLSLRAGLDSFYWAYLESMGSSIEGYPFIRSQKEITQVRHPHDYYV